MKDQYTYIIFMLMLPAMVCSPGLISAQQSSANYFIDTDILSAGGSECGSANYLLISTLGQPTAIGPASSTNYLNDAGFWYTVPQEEEGCYWLGDMDCNNEVDISDVILILRIALHLDHRKTCSDINEDTNVDIADVILTLRIALGLDPKVPC